MNATQNTTTVRQELDRRLEANSAAYRAGLLPLTVARMNIGTASRRARLAYNFPNLFGWLNEQARMDRIDPDNSPDAILQRKLEQRIEEIKQAFQNRP